MRGLLEYIGWMADNAEADAVLRDAMKEGKGAAVAARTPEPVPATKMLRTQLERVALAYTDRERVLVKELAERDAELADIRNARGAATSALMELGVGELAEVGVEEMTLEEIMAEWPEGIDVTQIDGALDLSAYYVDRKEPSA